MQGPVKSQVTTEQQEWGEFNCIKCLLIITIGPHRKVIHERVASSMSQAVPLYDMKKDKNKLYGYRNLVNFITSIFKVICHMARIYGYNRMVLLDKIGSPKQHGVDGRNI